MLLLDSIYVFIAVMVWVCVCVCRVRAVCIHAMYYGNVKIKFHNERQVISISMKMSYSIKRCILYIE